MDRHMCRAVERSIRTQYGLRCEVNATVCRASDLQTGETFREVAVTLDAIVNELLTGRPATLRGTYHGWRALPNADAEADRLMQCLLDGRDITEWTTIALAVLRAIFSAYDVRIASVVPYRLSVIQKEVTHYWEARQRSGYAEFVEMLDFFREATRAADQRQEVTSKGAIADLLDAIDRGVAGRTSTSDFSPEELVVLIRQVDAIVRAADRVREAYRTAGTASAADDRLLEKSLFRIEELVAEARAREAELQLVNGALAQSTDEVNALRAQVAALRASHGPSQNRIQIRRRR